jgi:hypothetical protein
MCRARMWLPRHQWDMDRDTNLVAGAVHTYVESIPLNERLQREVRNRLLLEAARLNGAEKKVRPATKLTAFVGRSYTHLAGIAALFLLAVLSLLLPPNLHIGQDRVPVASAAEIFAHHERLVSQGLPLEAGQVLHQRITLQSGQSSTTEDSWQLVGPDGAVQRSYTRYISGGQTTAEIWFDGRYRIFRQAGSGSISVVLMAPFRPIGGLGGFGDVNEALQQGQIPSGAVSTIPNQQASPATNVAANAYRVTGAGSIAGRRTIVVEGRISEFQFDVQTFELLDARLGAAHEVVTDEELSTALPPAAYSVPNYDPTTAALLPPASQPDAAGLSGLPRYVPQGLQLDSLAFTGGIETGAKHTIMVRYKDQEGRVQATIQRANQFTICQDAAANCGHVDVSGHPATVRTTQQANGETWHWLQWEDGQGEVLIYGTLAVDEMLNMARSMPS